MSGCPWWRHIGDGRTVGPALMRTSPRPRLHPQSTKSPRSSRSKTRRRRRMGMTRELASRTVMEASAAWVAKLVRPVKRWWACHRKAHKQRHPSRAWTRRAAATSATMSPGHQQRFPCPCWTRLFQVQKWWYSTMTKTMTTKTITTLLAAKRMTLVPSSNAPWMKSLKEMGWTSLQLHMPRLPRQRSLEWYPQPRVSLQKGRRRHTCQRWQSCLE
mmetsp:Transcript_42698/g.135670  ORF Transcript_42698/g.135670 Transcript_42698/m.135670 type:complete len:215 (-) Transcript_42698:720-1364(-)